MRRRQFEGHKINLFSANWSKFFDRALIHLCELILFPKQQAKMMSTWMLLNLLIWSRSSWNNKKKIGWFSISVPFVNTNNKGHSKCPLVSHAWVRSIKAWSSQWTALTLFLWMSFARTIPFSISSESIQPFLGNELKLWFIHGSHSWFRLWGRNKYK